MIDPGLLKAARTLADLSQKDLAAAAGLGHATIVEIEAGRSRPMPDTVAAILGALERSGVQIHDGAVRRLSGLIRFIEGDDCYLKLLDDVAATLEGKDKPEFLIFFGDDGVSPQKVIEKYRILRSSGIRMKQLVCEGNTNLMGELHEYRYVPQENFLNRVCVVYGDKVAMVTKTDTKRILVITDAELAGTQRNLFELIWSKYPVPVETNAPNRF